MINYVAPVLSSPANKQWSHTGQLFRPVIHIYRTPIGPRTQEELLLVK